MEKEKLKLPYEDATLEILKFSALDVIATSGEDDWYQGPTHSGSGSWT
ncbi:MAG: hypothetical protein IJX92_04455 [Clostridia bacterium]|nr:hypothetical protein [Clostridia bacterium]